MYNSTINKLHLLILGGCILAGCSTHHVAVRQSAPDNKSIVILYENDVHCAMDGYAKMAGLRNAVSDTAWTQVVSCGDYFSGGTIGAISKGSSITDVMKLMGYNAITLGNHEFDFRSPRLLELMDQVGDVVTCSNYIRKSDGQSVFADYIMSEVGGKKIAYVGVVTPTVLNSMPTAFRDSLNALVYDLVPDEIFSRVQAAADKAHAAGADYVIVLSHLGENPNDSYITSQSLIAATRGIDALLDGHSHSVIPMNKVKNLDGKEIPVSQTGTLFANIGHLLITPDGTLTTSLIPVKEIDHLDATVQHVVDSVKNAALEVTSREVGYTDVDLMLKSSNGFESARCMESSVGNLVADAFRITCDADVTILNAGSIRNSLKVGKLTYGDLISLLPYDNMMCLAEVTGEQIVEAIRRNCVNLPLPDGQFPVVSGLRYSVDVKSHEVSDVMVLDKNSGNYVPLDMTAHYTLASTDYAVFNGGLRKALVDAKILKKGIMLYCDAFVDYVIKNLGGHITAENARCEGRITLINKE